MSDRVLDLRSLLHDLHKTKRIRLEDVNFLLGSTRTREQAAMHPLSYIGGQKLEDLTRPGKHLDEMALTAWIAEQSGLTVFHIDPMKMQVAELADVMSYQFAKRHDLLCVKITPDELTVAVGQPFVTGW
ncbi:MAG TPA: type II/IV secretion system protein, partial [Cellvibrionaceae bacterium]|nr:type II/IV secretion system protein [Cellvibrionaceae bacterium]